MWKLSKNISSLNCRDNSAQTEKFFLKARADFVLRWAPMPWSLHCDRFTKWLSNNKSLSLLYSSTLRRSFTVLKEKAFEHCWKCMDVRYHLRDSQECHDRQNFIEGDSMYWFLSVHGSKQGCVLAPALLSISWRANWQVDIRIRTDGGLLKISKKRRDMWIRDLLLADDSALVAHSPLTSGDSVRAIDKQERLKSSINLGLWRRNANLQCRDNSPHTMYCCCLQQIWQVFNHSCLSHSCVGWNMYFVDFSRQFSTSNCSRKLSTMTPKTSIWTKSRIQKASHLGRYSDYDRM